MEVHVNDQADGLLSQSGDRWQIRFERRLAHPPGKAWRALSRGRCAILKAEALPARSSTDLAGKAIERWT